MGVVVFDSTDYEISVDLKPGQGGKGTGSGTGHFTLEGAIIFNFCTGEFSGPFEVTVDLAVTNAANVGASTSQGVNVQTNPLTGETRIVRQHVIGQQAEGGAAGSLSILLDGELVADVTGGLGLVQANRVHSVQQIR
ncbi:MAG: hypothetical protein C4547_12960 [Phycisphaerales bacterium]|nr:MAG: hypothetical protein C4547_12960 [Phycisphaerales bacterium]